MIFWDHMTETGHHPTVRLVVETPLDGERSAHITATTEPEAVAIYAALLSSKIREGEMTAHQRALADALDAAVELIDDALIK